MKLNKIIIFLFISMLLFNCKEKNEPLSDINISICGIENPRWLLTQISDILNQSSNYRPVKISVYKNIDTEIISIEDPVNSNASRALMFFECSGKQIEFNSEKYNEYSILLKENKFILLWSN